MWQNSSVPRPCTRPATLIPMRFVLKEGGFEVGKFDKTPAKPYGALGCVKGKVDKLDVLICHYKDAAGVKAANKKVTRFLEGAVSGAMRQRDKLLLVVADRDKIDIKGKKIDKLLKTFHPKKAKS